MCGTRRVEHCWQKCAWGESDQPGPADLIRWAFVCRFRIRQRIRSFDRRLRAFFAYRASSYSYLW